MSGLIVSRAALKMGPGAIVRTVQDFGAKGGGVVDDTAAFKRALASKDAVIRIPVGVYRITEGLTIPGKKQLQGDAIFCSNVDGAGPGGAVLKFDNAVQVCLTVDGRTEGSGGDTPGLRGVVVGRVGVPPAGSVGVLVRGAYNSTMEDVFSHNHAVGFKWLGRGGSDDVFLSNGLACNCARLYTGAISDCHFLVDSWPELRVTGGRSGMNGLGDYAGKSFIRITSPEGGTGGAGPNTIVFMNYQFNQGGTEGPEYFIEFVSNTAGVGNQVIYQFTNCHVENITAAYVKSYASAGYLQRMHFTGGTLNTKVPLFDLNAATSINNVGFANMDIAASTIVVGSNYVNGLSFSGNNMTACAATLTAPPTNNWSVAFSGNTWNNASSLTIAGTGWASCVVNDSFGFNSTVTDNSGSKKVAVDAVSRNVAQWIPQLAIGGNTDGITYAEASGVYQLVGRVVTLDFKIALSSKGINVGAVTLKGLPFAPAGIALDGHSGACGYVQNCTLQGSLTVRVKNVNELEFRQSTGVGNMAITQAELTNSTLIYGSLSYFI